MCSGIDPVANADVLREHVKQASGLGAEILFTPEMTGMMDCDRKRARSSVSREEEDPVLKIAVEAARSHQIWINLGSLAIRDPNYGDEKWVNRSFLINTSGKIVARYDKIHLFDVSLGSEAYRESSAYHPGKQAVIARWDNHYIGLSICYDLRFSNLYGALAEAGAEIIVVPAAFTVQTGRAHWETLLRTRAIESAAFVVAATQCGSHGDGRKTYGHSMVIDPWGEVLLDMGNEIGVSAIEIDMDRILEVRTKIPVLDNRQEFQIPQKVNRDKLS